MVNWTRKFVCYLLLAALLAVSVRPEIIFAVSSDSFVNGGLNNNIISDTDFLNINSMTADQIQSFLTSNNSFLAGYSENGRSAAQIIYDAAHGANDASGTYNGIVINTTTGTVNPEVILTTLQKEQSLITRTDNNAWAMTASMGFACYSGVAGDNNNDNCADAYAGFTKQVENGAWELRYSFERAKGRGLDYQVGQTFATSDSYTVTLMDAATASLYRYTPYVFNGNFNFYNYFMNWFGSHPDNQVNDTDNFTLLTYINSQTISGAKTSTSTVYLGTSKIADPGAPTWTINLTNLAIGTNSYTINYAEAGATVASKSITITVQKPGDINGDGTVNISDLSILAGYWAQTNPEQPLADLNGDHVVNISDLSILAGHWGQ